MCRMPFRLLPEKNDFIDARLRDRAVLACAADADGKFAWTLKGPDAELRDRKNKIVGSHFAGPTWKLNDSSEVTGKAVAD